jgi:hypothetical protein
VSDLPPIVIDGKRYSVARSEPQRSLDLYRLLGLLVDVNKRQMRARGTVPPPAVHVRGLRYQPEKDRRENWQSAEQLWRTLRGDCEDLACYEAARLQLAGINASPALHHNVSGGYHVTCAIPRVSVGYGVQKSINWDPSAALGMDD